MLYKKIFYLIFVFLLVGCSKNELENIEKPQKIFPYKKHTVVLYAMADNDLYPYAEKNIQDVENQWKKSFDGNFVVVLDAPNYVRKKRPSIFKIEEKNNIEILPNTTDFQLANVEVMKKILTKLKLQFPSDKYTLILWSHGTGWLPKGFDLQQDLGVPSKSFGKDRNKEMSIFELSEALPDNGFETIIFDACFMASVEVLYELRRKSKYFIASSAEILQTGFPYQSLTSMFFDSDVTPIHWAKAFFDFYNSKKGMYRSATISVTENHFFDSLAQVIKYQISENQSNFEIKKQEIQRFDRSETPIFYDFFDYFKKLNNQNNIQTQNIIETLENLVIYKAHTPQFAKQFTISNHSGLTTYILSETSRLSAYYKKYSWYNFIYTM